MGIDPLTPKTEDMSYINDIKRLVWRFTESASFRPNENDNFALTGLIKTCQAVENDVKEQNRLFFNLYVHVYHKYCLYYDATPDIKIPQVELNRLLDEDLETLLEKFAEDMNLIEIERAIEAGVDLKKAKVWGTNELKRNMSAQFTQAVLNKMDGGKVRRR